MKTKTTLQEELQNLKEAWKQFYTKTYIYKACIWVLNKLSKRF